MKTRLEVEQLSSQYSLVDISDLDGEMLLASENFGDGVLALLAHFRDPLSAIQSIVAKLANLPQPERQDAFSQLLILSGLRKFSPIVREEVAKMPVTENIFDHELLKPAYQSGIREGLQQGLQQGQLKGEQTLLRKLIEKRFGPLPSEAVARLDRSSVSDLEEIGSRLLEATSLSQLLPAE